jgi:hypothetical protein
MADERISSEEAKQRILERKVRGGLKVDGLLDLAGNKQLTSLPRGLQCYELDASRTSLKELPDDLQVECSIKLENCKKLASLPDGLTTGTLNLSGCTALKSLPENLNLWYLDISGCRQITDWPRRGKIHHGGLNLSGCAGLSSLPAYVRKLATLDVTDCLAITELPKQLEIGLWLECGGSGLTGLHLSQRAIGLRWRGVQVDYKTAFQPEQINAQDALKERNTERRRVMIERMGFDRFLREAQARLLNRDQDPGGERKLLRVSLQDDEDLVCLSCNCPSTGRHYLLRVPPNMKTCHQAAAWIAGYDDPKKYKPVMET